MTPLQARDGGAPQPKPAFLTLDECIQAADELAQRLRQLGARKHPLDVRKGIGPKVEKAVTQTVRGASRTYFFDVRAGKDRRPYLLITESRLNRHQRVQITVFPEDALRFLEALGAVVAQLESSVR